MDKTRRIIVVEDDHLTNEYLQDLCRDFGCDVVGAAHNGREGIQIVEQLKPDFLLSTFALGPDPTEFKSPNWRMAGCPTQKSFSSPARMSQR